jgi:hypothetical protein
MKRLLVLSLGLPWLAACSLNPMHANADQARVLAKSDYCGTSSQTAAVHYFGDGESFGNWASQRGITEFDGQGIPASGVAVVEMGQRPTGGYNIRLDEENTGADGDTFTLRVRWEAPRLDAAVSQALIAPCLLIQPPPGDYRRIQLVDQLGNTRATARVR